MENKELSEFKKKIRTAIADYLSSEGCDCCRGSNHKEHEATIAKLLNIPMYSDKSGYDFGKYESEETMT